MIIRIIIARNLTLRHFLTNSPWSHELLLNQVGQDLNKLMQAEKRKHNILTGFIIDESSHLKKGKHSVGVARQYAGTVGKVDNCQVG
ncbi:MAG: transposase, partial [Bacteroidota bacterium]